jgi:hypothetical protein
MAAVPFVETLILKGLSNGRTIQIPLTVSDVTGAYAIAPDGNSFIQLPSDQPYAIIDCLTSVGGTDTRFQDLYCNGLSTGITVVNLSNLNTANFRQFQNAPVGLKAGAMLRLVQRT